MPGSFTLTGKVQQVTKDGADGGIDEDVAVATGWTATLTSNYPKGVPLPDGSDIDYVDVRTVTLLSDGSITEDGVNTGISLMAHDPAEFATALQWTIKPGPVTLTSGVTLRPKPWTFNAPLNGVSTTLGALTPVVGIPLQPAPDSVPWGSVTGAPTALTAGPNVANGYAGLDGTGKIGTAQLPISAMEYKGNWNASTNSPTLADGSGSAGDVYKVATGAARNLGSGSITFTAGDYVIYNGTTWELDDTTDAVSSVAGLAGAVGSSALTDALTDGSVNKVLTAADKARLANTSGTNTGDQATVDAATHAATGKTTPVDADEIPLADSAASFGLKKLTWANLKTILFTNPTITNYTESVVPIGNTSTAKTISLTSGTMQTATLTGNCTFTMPTAVAGKSFSLALATGAGGFTATFTGVKWAAATAPTVTVAASKSDVFTFSCFDGSNWIGSVMQAVA